MDNREHQKLVQLAQRRALATDKAKIQIGALSRFGLVELTRQRTRPSHKLVASSECPYCTGTGSIKTAESFEIDCMRAMRQTLAGRNVARLEVVVPQDLAVSVLNARHQEITALEERYDSRIVFTGDQLMKAREFRLVTTVRKGERNRGGDRPQPVRPSLLAPLMVEQAKAMQLAKELAAMKSEDLERELNADIPQAATPASQPPPQPIPVVAAPVVRAAPALWEDAATLRRLLFSPNQPVAVTVARAQQELAPRRQPASVPDPRSRRRRRRR
jgi:ribonuclease E